MFHMPMNLNSLSSAKDSQRDLGPDLSRSSNMSKIRGRDTAPEMLLRKALWHRGFRFRVNVKVGGARPDIVFTSRKLVIFIDGCFWHAAAHSTMLCHEQGLNSGRLS